MRDDGKAASSASGTTPAAAALAVHKRHGTFDSKLFRIFRTLSNGKSELRQWENPSPTDRKIPA